MNVLTPLISQGPIIILVGLIALIVIGVIIIVIAGVLLALIPAIIVSGIVFFISGNQTYAGVAFLLIALLSLTRRKK
jgi:hypothetical protein